jgi:hypothetical protein
MPLIVEDGTAKGDAESYVTTDAVVAYATARGRLWLPESPALAEAACRNATTWLDGTYRDRFPGYKRRGRGQGLEWPRISAYVPDSGIQGWALVPIPETEVPREVLWATCEAAIKELSEPGSLSPDMDVGGLIQSVQAGSASVTFAGGGLSTSGARSFPVIDIILRSLLPETNPYSGRTGRG